MRSSKKYGMASPGWARALAVWGLVLLMPPAPTAETPGEEPVVEVPQAAGLRVYLDPDTGEVTSDPSREQVEALSAEILSAKIRSQSVESTLSRSSVGLELFELDRGGHGVYLEGRFRSSLVVRLTADGAQELA